MRSYIALAVFGFVVMTSSLSAQQGALQTAADKLGTLKIAMAIAAGNTLVLKAAEDAPLGLLRVAQICNEHLPPGPTRPRHRDSSRRRDATPIGGHHHGDDQGQHLVPDRLCGP